MTVFDKARELSDMILETPEYKILDKAKINYENHVVSKDELIKATKKFDNLKEQIFLLISLNINDDEIEISSNSQSKCDNCNKFKNQN